MPVLTGNTTIQFGTGPILGSIDANRVAWRINRDGFTGWGEPATTLAPTQRVRANGAWVGDSFTQGRTPAVVGTITAPTAALLNSSIDALIASLPNAATVMTVTESGVPATMSVRRQGETIVQKITTLIASYSVQVFAPDPRKLGIPLVGTTTLPSSSGGLTWPHTWPETWTATTVSGNVSLTNPGTKVGPVVLRIDGPCTGPQVTHAGTGRAIAFASSLVLGAGEWLTIDMDAHQTLANDQANRAQYIISDGWSGFDPGSNLWAFSAAAYNASSLLTVTAWPAR